MTPVGVIGKSGLLHGITDAGKDVRSHRVISIGQLILLIKDVVPSSKDGPVLLNFIAGLEVEHRIASHGTVIGVPIRICAGDVLSLSRKGSAKTSNQFLITVFSRGIAEGACSFDQDRASSDILWILLIKRAFDQEVPEMRSSAK